MKFQRNQSKTVGEVVYTICIVSIHFGWKNDYVHFVKKVTKGGCQKRLEVPEYAEMRHNISVVT